MSQVSLCVSQAFPTCRQSRECYSILGISANIADNETYYKKSVPLRWVQKPPLYSILQLLFWPPMYMWSIAAFQWTVAIALVFCGVLQRRDIEPPQYICFSGVNLDIVVLQNPTAINISFRTYNIAAI